MVKEIIYLYMGIGTGKYQSIVLEIKMRIKHKCKNNGTVFLNEGYFIISNYPSIIENTADWADG